MLVKDLLKELKRLTDEEPSVLEKEITFFDYQKAIVYDTPKIPTFVDLSDTYYLDIVFNYDPNTDGCGCIIDPFEALCSIAQKDENPEQLEVNNADF